MAPAEQLHAETPTRPDSPAPMLTLTPRGTLPNQRRDPTQTAPAPPQPPPRPDSPAPRQLSAADQAAALLRPDSPRPPGFQAAAAQSADAAYAPPAAGDAPYAHAGGSFDSADAGFASDPGSDQFLGSEHDEKMMEVIHLDAIYSVQKMAEVLVQGPDSEREFILFELQQLLDHCLDDTMKILLPVLCEHVPSWNVDLQIKAAKRLFDVVTFQLEPVTANMITCASFGVIQAAKGKPGVEFEELYNLWGSILVDVLPNMKWTDQEISDVIAIIDIHADEALFTSRKVAARVLGALAQCLDRSKVEQKILPRAVDLFQDKDVEVRGTIVESLAFIGAALPVRITEIEVWPRVERLLEPPEDARIRATAMRTMAHILQAQREKNKVCRLFRDLLPPVFARLSAFARRFSAEDQRLVDDDTYLLLEVVSEVFGQFLYTLSLCARKSFRKEAYKGYAGMATCNGPLIRRNCAFNLPGVAKALGERYALELSGLCEFLAKDTDEEVRWILAAGIHQSATLLAPRGHFEKLFTAVCSLLQDENPLVRMNALGHFHDLLSAFAKDGSDPASVRRLAPVFTNLTMLSEGEWRIQRSLAEQLNKCADIIPSDSLVENVLPLLYRLTEQGTPLVREAAMKATAHSLRNIPSVSDRNAAINRFWNKAADGPFWMRLALLDGGAAAMRVFSRQRFAELFAAKVLSLADDPVANVRIRLSGMLASMAPMCAGAPQYGTALERLRRDKDVDVLAHMASHHERSVVAFRIARETAADDQAKFREEQEFYGLAQRSQKRGGRLNSIRGSLGAFSRQQSLDQGATHQPRPSSRMGSSNGPSSQSATVSMHSHSISALGAGIDPFTSNSMDGYDDQRSVRTGHTDGGASDDESAVPGDGLLNSLSRDGSAHEALDGDHGPSTGSTRGGSSVPVQKANGARPRVFQNRSKSWSGRLPHLPRQFSQDNREQKAGGKGRQESVKRKVSLKRRKKRRPDSTSDSFSDAQSASGHSIAASEEMLASSRSHDSGASKKFLDTGIPLEPSDGGVRVNGRTVSSSAMHFTGKAKREAPPGGVIGAAIGSIGRSMSTEEGRRRRHRSSSTNAHANAHMRNLAAESDLVGLATEAPAAPPSETGSYKSAALWSRKAAGRSPSRGRKSAKSGVAASGTTSASGARSGRKHGGYGGTTATSQPASSGGGGFLRGLFRKRK